MFIWMVLHAVSIWSSHALLCDLKNLKISCTDLEPRDLYDPMAVRLDPKDVLDLTVINATINSIDGAMFGKYVYMHTLNLNEIQLKNIENNTFVDLLFLRNLYLSGNVLESFKSSVFSATNGLSVLDISNNFIANLDEFDVSFFPSLTLMNISSNKLENLPYGFLNRLQNEEDFYLIIDDNPWDCLNLAWLQNFKDTVKAAFCEVYAKKFIEAVPEDPPSVRLEEQFPKIAENTSEVTQKTNHTNLVTLCGYASRCFSYCVFWFVGGIWTGIILGNICKIKNLICAPKVTCMQEQDTQYERAHLR